ncbi:MAG: response regulator transcription factor [Pseudomonadota bacterium]|nr:response regulator transcription factor [Pseudomonadota bacterium]
MLRTPAVTVLLVEDALPVRQAIRAALDGIPGVRVIGEADNAERAIALVQRLAPDIVTIDVRLRESFGMDLLRELKRSKPRVRPVTIVLTNHVGEHVRQSCAELGADYFFDKALEFNLACDVIGRFVAERTSERQHG